MKNLFFSFLLVLLSMPNVGFSDVRVKNWPRTPFEEALRWRGADEKHTQDAEALMWYFERYLDKAVNPVQTPWCAAFIDAVLYKTGHKRMNTLWARDFLKYGEGVEGMPKKGDIVILKRKENYGHVGFFVRFRKDKNGNQLVAVLGGNTDGKVEIGYWTMDKVLGYRRIE